MRSVAVRRGVWLWDALRVLAGDEFVVSTYRITWSCSHWETRKSQIQMSLNSTRSSVLSNGFIFELRKTQIRMIWGSSVEHTGFSFLNWRNTFSNFGGRGKAILTDYLTFACCEQSKYHDCLLVSVGTTSTTSRKGRIVGGASGIGWC